MPIDVNRPQWITNEYIAQMESLIAYLQAAPLRVPPEDATTLSFAVRDDYYRVGSLLDLTEIVDRDRSGALIGYMPFGTLMHVINRYTKRAIYIDATKRMPSEEGILPSSLFTKFTSYSGFSDLDLSRAIEQYHLSELIGLASALYMCCGKNFTPVQGFSYQLVEQIPTIWDLGLGS